MKTTIIEALRLIVVLLLLGIGDISYSQLPPPPPSGEETQSNKLNGDSAPVGSGLLILLSLGGAYGGFKFYKKNRGVITE